MKLDAKELHKAIDAWIIKKGIDKAHPSAQFNKFMEEVEEAEIAFDHFMFEDDRPEGVPQAELFTDLLLEMGDVYVTLRALAMTLETDMDTAIALAYDKIKDRKGETINGVFVKEEDLD